MLVYFLLLHSTTMSALINDVVKQWAFPIDYRIVDLIAFEATK